ncbi:hypothetical protein HHK36_010926 [Tetracentron sinense]|uniref:Protein-tyrosine-phosphatase MKP1 n=1 Tax=Tetracentron sinense TaxID=13715 RepID=A0A834ZBX7_TETSI|nr:hypothetical protein HHK36_010926 [Tetracentron sinense]
MVGKEDAAGSPGQLQISAGRKAFWRSASWSSSRSSSQNSIYYDQSEDSADQPSSTEKQFRRFPLPLTPRSQQNSKARACLPPLQPLSIARRSLDEWPEAGSDDVGEWPQPPTPSGRGDSNKAGERLKLDLSSLQKNPDPMGNLVKRERIALFDKECSKVAEHIYLGGDAVARNREILRQNGITHVLNCVGFVCPEYFKADLVYKTLWLQDSPSEDITSILYDVFDYFEDVREQGGRVLVHCCQGVSRSTSLVIAYLMWREGQSFDDAFQYVKAARGIANPNMGFACQLLQCQKRVHAIPLSPTSVLRMYRMAPHSQYDPLHLVPKMLNDPSPSALDSRGAFIIHIPSAIYIWIGKSCESIMERDAKGAALQVIRYEKVQGPMITVVEGEEPSYFWDAFSNLPHLLDKSGIGVQVSKEQVESAVKICPGERKLVSYDADFEFFQKAITGGIVPPFASLGAGHETHLPARESNWSVLRRKFTPGNMKECVSVPKVSLSRVYSDTRLMVDTDNRVNKLRHLSADSSSSSSPPYFSPSSLSSDSSTSLKFSSESPLMSPSTSSCSLTPSPASSTSRDSSLLSSKMSLHPICNGQEAPSVNHTSHSCSQAVSSPSKRFSLSLAKRRGSLSPSLKLPTFTDDIRAKNDPLAFPANQQDCVRRSNNTCSLDKPSNKEQVLESNEGTKNEEEDLTQERRLRMSLGGGVVSDGSCDKECALVKTCGEPRRNFLLGEDQELTVPTGLVDNNSAWNRMQPLVCRWPSLEEVATLGAGDVDSASVFIFLASRTGVAKHKDRMLYLWVGRSFKHDGSRIQLDNDRDIGFVEEIDWFQVGCDFLTRMGLPEDIPIKILDADGIAYCISSMLLRCDMVSVESMSWLLIVLDEISWKAVIFGLMKKYTKDARNQRDLCRSRCWKKEKGRKKKHTNRNEAAGQEFSARRSWSPSRNGSRSTGRDEDWDWRWDLPDWYSSPEGMIAGDGDVRRDGISPENLLKMKSKG